MKVKLRKHSHETFWLFDSFLAQCCLQLRGCWCQSPVWFFVSTRLGLLWSIITPHVSEYAYPPPHVGVKNFAPSETSGLEVWSAPTKRTEESFTFDCAQTKPQTLRFLIIFWKLYKSRKTLFCCYFYKTTKYCLL